MKQIKQIRENYDFITEKEDSEMRKLTSLVRAGLFDSSKLPLLKRAIEKDVSRMTPAEKKVLMELLDSLMSEVLHSSSVYTKIKQDVRSNKELNETKKDHLAKFDPRFGINYPSEADMPQIIILKRKAIRVYPDNQKVGLYYSQALDRYVSIPFGAGIPVMNEEMEINEISKTLASKAYAMRRGQGDDEDDTTKKLKAADTLKRISKKYGKYTSATIEKDADNVKAKKDAEKEAVRKMKSLEVNPIVSLGALAGLGARKLVDKFKQKKAEKTAAKAASTTKAPETKAPESKSSTMSTSGKVGATFGAQKSTPVKVTIKPKEKETKAPETKSDQPSDAGMAGVVKAQSNKTKTIGYQSHSAETIPNIKHGAPKKAGGVFLPPSHPSRSTSAQPNVKIKPIKAAIFQKMQEDQDDTSIRSGLRRFFNIPDDPEHDNTEKNRKFNRYVNAAADTVSHPVGQAVIGGTGAGFIAKRAITSFAKRRAARQTAKGAATGAAAAVGNAMAPSSSTSSSDSSDKDNTIQTKDFNMQVKTNAPTTKSSTDAYERRKEISARKAFSEEIIMQLRKIKEEKEININGKTIIINKTIAEKIVETYNSLSKDNKKKMSDMLNESTESFKKVIDFAIRQA